MDIATSFDDGIEPSSDSPPPQPLAEPADWRQEIKNILHGELTHILSDIEWRVRQSQEHEARARAIASGEVREIRSVYAEDLNTQQHQITGYTMTANTPVGGSIAWTSVKIVFGGVTYDITDGNTANKYAWFVKPGSGTSVALTTGNVKPVLTADDCLVFFNNAGTPVNALTSTIPVAVVDGAIDSASIANGAVTAAKTDFYSALNTAITNAQTAADLAQATADGSITTYFQSAAPWANGSVQNVAKVGDIWYDSDDGQAYRWSGASGAPANTWVVIEDNSIAAALAAAQAAQTTANAKITTFYSAVAAVPTALAIGDLWVVTDLGNQLRRATATGTGSWVIVQISGSAIANGGVTNTQLGSGIDGAKLTAATVTATQLATNSVTPTKLNILQHILY
jgi:hypothetical protein